MGNFKDVVGTLIFIVLKINKLFMQMIFFITKCFTNDLLGIVIV